MYGIMWEIVEVYSVIVYLFVVEGFLIDVECINVEKYVLIYLFNLNIKVLKK